MLNLQVVNRLSTVVLKASLTGDQILESEIDTSLVFVSLFVNGPRSKSITPIGKEVPNDSKIQVITNWEVVPPILNSISPLRIRGEGGEDKSTSPVVGQGKIGKRQSNWGRDLHQIHIAEAGNDLLPGNKLGLPDANEVIGIYSIF